MAQEKRNNNKLLQVKKKKLLHFPSSIISVYSSAAIIKHNTGLIFGCSEHVRWYDSRKSMNEEHLVSLYSPEY